MSETAASAPRPVVLVVGGAGYLAQFVLQALSTSESASLLELHHTFRTRTLEGAPGAEGHALDLTDAALVQRVVSELRPRVIVNCAALTALGACEKEQEQALACNVPTALFAASKEAGALLVQLSTDQVYDGKHAPYAEEHAPGPLNVYGQSKMKCEEALRDGGGRGVLLRSSNILGPPAPYSGAGKFLQWVDGTLAGLSAARRNAVAEAEESEAATEKGRGSAAAVAAASDPPATEPAPKKLRRTDEAETISLWADEFRNFIWVHDICHVVRCIVEKELSATESELCPAAGVNTFNMGGPERLSRVDIGNALCRVHGHDASVISPGYRYDENGRDTGNGPQNPQDISMISEKLVRACGLTSFTRIEDALEAEKAKAGAGAADG